MQKIECVGLSCMSCMVAIIFDRRSNFEMDVKPYCFHLGISLWDTAFQNYSKEH